MNSYVINPISCDRTDDIAKLVTFQTFPNFGDNILIVERSNGEIDTGFKIMGVNLSLSCFIVLKLNGKHIEVKNIPFDNLFMSKQKYRTEITKNLFGNPARSI